VQDAHDRDRHHPPRLSRAVGAAALAAIAAAASAHAADVAGLPSPVAPLSPKPPLAGGATTSAESVRHRVSAYTVVRVSVDQSGAPFAVTATQRLDVRVLGDYFFTIGAPLVGVEATPGSDEVPGLRTDAIVWAGFNPIRRVLAARATLDAKRVRPSLPLRVELSDDAVTLVNATRTTSRAYSADAVRAPLLQYLRRLQDDLRHGRTPVGGTALLTSRPKPLKLSVVAPLRVVGTVAGHHVSLILRDRLVVHTAGPVDLRVAPVASAGVPGAKKLDGRRLLEAVSLASLDVARARQFDAFLGNPDPTGRSETTYIYRTVTRIAAAQPAAVTTRGRDWERSVLLLFGIVIAAVLCLAAWARS
jgi:hypothetical protein